MMVLLQVRSLVMEVFLRVCTILYDFFPLIQLEALMRKIRKELRLVRGASGLVCKCVELLLVYIYREVWERVLLTHGWHPWWAHRKLFLSEEILWALFISGLLINGKDLPHLAGHGCNLLLLKRRVRSNDLLSFLFQEQHKWSCHTSPLAGRRMQLLPAGTAATTTKNACFFHLKRQTLSHKLTLPVISVSILLSRIQIGLFLRLCEAVPLIGNPTHYLCLR